VAVGATGVRMAGRRVLAAARSGLPGPLRDQFARYELVDVTSPRPDVALAHKQARAVIADGAPLDVGHTMSALHAHA
jgi:hypothetical protein